MSLELTFTAKDGAVPPSILRAVMDAVSRSGDKPLILTLKRYTKRRSSKQNRFYWGVLLGRITDAFQDAGNEMDEEEVHAYLKEHVGKLTRYVTFPNGEVKKILGSTKRLTTVEFENYLEKIRVWAAEMDIYLPLPNEEFMYNYQPKE